MNNLNPTPAQIAKLPKWAQWHIQTITRDLAALKAAATLKDSRITARYAGQETIINNDARVEFALKDVYQTGTTASIRVSLAEDGESIDIMGSSNISIAPGAANRVTIKTEGY